MIWHSQLLSQFSNLAHGSTSKSFGVRRFASAEDKNEVLKNRKALLESIPVDPNQAFILFQEHGDNVLRINAGQKGTAFDEQEDLPVGDGLITKDKDVTLIARSADCVPVFFYDAKNEVIGVAHAGWKGTSKKVVQRVIESMKNEYNSYSQDIFVVIGPSICGQCYDISTTTDNRKEEFNRLFKKENDVVLSHQDGSISLDLKRANKLLALETGVLEEQIEVSSICTFEDERYASYRRNADELGYSIWSYICMRMSSDGL